MNSFTLRFAGIFLLGVAIASGSASGWWPGPQTAADATPQTEPADKPKTTAPPKQDPKTADKPKTLDKSKDAPKAGEKLRPEVKPKVKPDPKAKSRAKAKANAARRAAAKKRKTKSRFEFNPDAKWVCEQQTATLEPVWRGESTLTFPFLIRNDGTADLRIRAKGG